MTKKVRIENADTSDYKVVVQTWQKGAEGQPDTCVNTKVLSYPTQIDEFLIHSGQYVVIKEAT